MGELIDRDREHLRQLTLAYYVMAGFIAFFSLFGLLYVGIGGMMMSGGFPQPPNSGDDPRAFGMIFAAIGAIVVGAGLVIAFLTFLTGRSIRDRRRRTFCLIVAGLSCLHIPWGTALGVCTIMVLERPSVKLLFRSGASSQAADASPATPPPFSS